MGWRAHHKKSAKRTQDLGFKALDFGYLGFRAHGLEFQVF